jgi:hypothetical protein
MPYKDTIRLSFAHNLIVGNVPAPVELEKFSGILEKESKLDLESFGIFETASPNYSTYYPDVTAEDLNPKDGEFIEPIYRALSEVIVHKQWNPIDFSLNNVLKNSMSLLKGQSVYIDHETAVGNAVGAIKDVFWQGSYKVNGNGILVPAGINARLKVDGKSNPRIARGILMDPPSIHSTSVTVEFLWEKSHASLSTEEFFRALGTYDKEGQMIRRIATKVSRYHEISLVGHGADPYAQKVNKDGSITNPKYADISNNSEEKQKQKFFSFDFKSEIIQNSERTIPDESNTSEDQVGNTENDHNKNTPTMNFLEKLAQHLGLPATATEAEIEAKLKEQLTALQTKTAEVTTLTEAKAQLEKDKPDVTNLQAFQTNVLTAKRAEVTRLYKIAFKEPQESILTMINSAPWEALTALEKQYGEQAEAIAPLSCTKCGSTEVSRASSKQENTDEGGNQSDKKVFSVEETYERLNNRLNKSDSAKHMHS